MSTTVHRRLGNTNAILRSLGLDIARSWQVMRGSPRFIRNLVAYRAQSNGDPFPIELRGLRPVLEDFDSEAGRASGHYFYQDLWAARKIWQVQPSRHVDVGSRIDGFVAHILTFMPVEVIDIRPLRSKVPGLTFVQADATELTCFADSSLESLSSLHAVEHFGLGRYGDPIDPSAWYRAMRAMVRVLNTNGKLYFAVPIGRQRLQFNSHRVFSPQTILKSFRELKCLSFAVISDDGEFHDSAQPDDFEDSRNACGLFEFIKLD